eukprot:GHVL01045100.1.p1 GENE.GHVL01045100.1~~GHVL01045100.1.p1  ORF type:complete len:212 (+),score=28.08 GHVL01045100.1:59-694(+)
MVKRMKMVAQGIHKDIVIDGRGHLMGRLASKLAKGLLRGQRFVVVRCEEINISGSLYRNKLKYQAFLRKRTNSNPRKGPFHHRAPSMIVHRCIRGMMPHKTKRGLAALERLRVFDGIPAPFDRKKRMVIPDALKVLRLKPHRKNCRLGDLSEKVGWGYADVLERLEAKRKVKSEAYWAKSTAKNEELKAAIVEATKKLSPDEKAILAKCGY